MDSLRSVASDQVEGAVPSWFGCGRTEESAEDGFQGKAVTPPGRTPGRFTTARSGTVEA